MTVGPEDVNRRESERAESVNLYAITYSFLGTMSLPAHVMAW